MSVKFPDVDTTEGRIEPVYYPGEEEVPVTVWYRTPESAGQQLLRRIEEERADRAYQLSKYLNSEIEDEYKRRFPF